MRETCKNNNTCKQKICLDIACSEYSPYGKSEKNDVLKELERRIISDGSIEKLLQKEPLFYRFHTAMDKFGDDPVFIANFVISLCQLKKDIQDELFKLATDKK